MGRLDAVVRSYHFLVEKEQLEEPFTLRELCEATGWQASTARTYVSKKWEPFLQREDDHFFVHGVSGYQESEYVRLMSQANRLSAAPKRPPIPDNVERLIVKAREAAINALDSYNRPSTIFRTEGFVVMMVIAWRSLFHAIFEKRGVNYFYENDDGSPMMVDGEEKAWDLTECLKAYYGDANPPMRFNLKFIIGLRNRIEHRFAPKIDAHVAGECQALLLNFDDLLVQEFGDYYALRESLAVPLQTSRLRSDDQLKAMQAFHGKEYDELKDYIDTFRSSILDTVYQDPRYSFRVYLIPKLGNHESSSDLAFEFVKYDPSNPEDMAALEKQVVLIKERQIPVANAGLFKPSQVARIVSEKIGRPFSVYNHTQAWKMYNVRRPGPTPEGCNVRYCQFDQVHGDHVYTLEWINFLIQVLSDEKQYQRLLNYRK